MIVCEEMQKLRAALDQIGILWGDKSKDFEMLDLNGCVKDVYICRTHFDYNNKQYSVINGYGSYGGYDLFCDVNKGLLEIMFPDGSVEGYLTAKEILQKIDFLEK